MYLAAVACAFIAFLPTAFVVSSLSELQGNDWHTHQIAREYVGPYLASICDFAPGYHADYAGPCLMRVYTYYITAQIIIAVLSVVIIVATCKNNKLVQSQR